MVLFYIVIDFSPTSTTTNARFACALYLRPEGQSFTALFDKRQFYGRKISPIGVQRFYTPTDTWTVPTADYFEELFRVSKHQIIWGVNYFGIEIEVPKWVNYIATDKNGDVYAYKIKPNSFEFIWIGDGTRCDDFAITGMWGEPKRLINGVEVPECVDVDAWEEGERYWYVDFNSSNHTDMVGYSELYFSKQSHINLIHNDLVFKTKEGAIAMVKALLNYKVECKNDE